MSFTTADAFTFVICAWVDEVVSLGVSPNLKSTVLSLWAKYLRQMQVAFVEDRHCRRRQVQPGPGLAPSFRDVQVGMYKRRRLITTSEWAHKRAARSRQTARQHLVDQTDYTLLDQEDDSREARRVRSRMRRNFHKQLANERVAVDPGTEKGGGATSEDSAASFLSDASFLSGGGCGSGTPVGGPASSSSAASAIDEVEEERSDVVGTQTRAIERVTLHRPKIRNSTNEQICRLTLRNAFGLFSLGVFLHGDPKVTLTTSDLAFGARSGAISYTNASIHIPELLVIRGSEDANKFIGRIPPTRKDLQDSIYKMGSFLQLVKVNLGCPEIFSNVLRRFLMELSLPQGLENEIMQAFASTNFFEFTAELLPTKSLINSRWPERTPAMDERALGVIIFALKYICGLDDNLNDAVAGGEWNLPATSSAAAEDELFNISDWIKLSRHRAFWACKRTHLLRHRLGKLFPGVELSEAAALHEVEQNILMTTTSRASVATNTGAMGYVTKFQENLSGELKTEIFSKDDCVDRLEDDNESCDFSGSLTPLKDYTVHRLKCLKKETALKNDSLKREELEVLEKLSAMRQSTLKMKPTRVAKEGKGARMPYLISNRSEFRRRMGAAPSNDMYSEEIKRKKLTRGGEDLTTRVWRLEVATKWQKTVHNSADFLQEQLLSAVPEDFGWVLRYVSTCFDCSVVDVYRNTQEAEKLALKMDPSYFGEISDPKKANIFPHLQHK